jgi:phospholipid/cholesterol/gamma-HCH transport system substrate-binding protein
MTATMNTPQLAARLVVGVAAVVAIVVLVSLATGGSSYDLKLTMSDASGLRPGSQVLLGGVSVGSVNALNLGPDNTVIADLHLTPGQVNIGQGASVRIIGANLLGEKYAALQPGNPSNPLPSGTTLPESATTIPTDLDQIVDVLDGGTRARLATLLQEAGLAVAGRRSDVGAILRQLPLSVSAATQLLDTLVQDNHTLGDLITNSNQFVSRINAQSNDLKQIMGAGAQALTTLSQSAGSLRQAVAGAPQALSTINNFFVQGTAAITRLTPAAGAIANTAPELNALLTRVKPFTQAAVPTLNRAAAVAPDLTKLAEQATPTVKSAVPTINAIENIANLAKPATAWTAISAKDLFSIFQGWSRAIQFRDGLSHVFNGDLFLDPAIVLGAANAGATAAQRCQNLLDIKQPGLLAAIGLLHGAQAARQKGCNTAAIRAARPAPAAPTPPATVTQAASAATGTATTAVGGLTSALSSTLGKVLGGVGATVGKVLAGTGATVGNVVNSTKSALGKLLGSGSGSSTSGNSTTPAGSPPPSGPSLQNLLNYLLGK